MSTLTTSRQARRDSASSSAASRSSIFENRYRTKGGEYRWLSWVAVPEKEKLFSTARDVTEDKERARILAERAAERDRLWSNSQDIQVVIDGKGVFQAVNPAFTAILGWTPDDALGRPVFDLVLPEDEAVTDDALDRARHSALPIVENRYRHKDGGFL